VLLDHLELGDCLLVLTLVELEFAHESIDSDQKQQFDTALHIL